MSMKDYFSIVKNQEYDKPDFEIFRGNVCHYVKNMGDMKFIIYLLKNDYIRQYWERSWYEETFYLLAALDYLCRENDLPLCEEYGDIRQYALDETKYSRDILLSSALSHEFDKREECKQNSIPEFIRFNIVEGDIRDVC